MSMDNAFGSHNITKKRVRDDNNDDDSNPTKRQAVICTEVSEHYTFPNGKYFTILLYFPSDSCEIGLQQRLKLVVNSDFSDEPPTNVEIIPVDTRDQGLQLCPQQKMDHQEVMKIHDAYFSKGQISAYVTFYCKGKSALCGGCTKKTPSKIRLFIRYTLKDKTIQTGYSSIFSLKSNRRKSRAAQSSYSWLRNEHNLSLCISPVLETPSFVATVIESQKKDIRTTYIPPTEPVPLITLSYESAIQDTFRGPGGHTVLN